MRKLKEYLIHVNTFKSTNKDNQAETAIKIDNESQTFTTPRGCNISATEHHDNNNFSKKVQLVTFKIKSTL